MRKINKGDRLRLIRMKDDPNPVEPGTEGTVDHLDDLGHIHMNWDNGRTLSLIPGVDEYEIIEQEVSEKKVMDFNSYLNKK